MSPEKRGILHRLAMSASMVSEDERAKFTTLLLQYADIFDGPGDKLGRTTKLKHTINTGTFVPNCQRSRRTPPAQREIVRGLLDEMKANDIIQPSCTGWSSPIVLARKKDDGVRFCVDYRRLNEITHKDAYPLPCIDDTLEMLSESKLFSTLDLASRYWQVELAEEAREKNTFLYK